MARKLEDRSQPVAERLDIIKAFGDWATAQVRPPLVAVSRDPQPEVRQAATRALGWPGNDAAVPALRERVEMPGETPAVKAAAVRSLGRIGDRSARALVVGLTRDSDASIREAALWSVALGDLIDPADRTSYLIQFAEARGFDAELRVEAIKILSNVKELRVVESLSRILESEPPVMIVLPSGPPTPSETMNLRSAQIKDVAGWAAGALGKLEAKAALPLLLKSAENPTDFFLRLVSIQSLALWDVPEAFPVFVRRLEDPLPDVRLVAVIGLARLADSKGVEPILGRLSDAAPSVRAQAVAALVVLGGPKIRPQLEALQQTEPDPDVRAALEAALSELSR